jgi:hypothetical protein
MIDFETLGKAPDGVVFEVALAVFDRENGITETWDSKINHVSCIQYGGRLDSSVMDWWLREDKTKFAKLNADAPNQPDVKDVMVDIHALIAKYKAPRIWSKGAGFDIPILNFYMNKVGLVPPWTFANEKCVRTMFGLIPGIEYKLKMEGEKHTALDDVMHQVYVLSEVYNRLGLMLD